MGGGQIRLTVQRPWEGGLTPAVPTSASEYTIEAVNPNLLVDEDEETDFTFLNDTDNVTSFNELPSTAGLTVTADRLTGLGMSDNQTIGGKLIPGGLTYVGLEQLTVNLGPGANRVTVLDTHGGVTVINAGAGADVFDVRAVSGHTFLNAGAGADKATVSDAGLVSGIGALLTLTGDVPQVTVTVLGRGSAADPTADVDGANEVQQVVVDATGGDFRLGFQGAFTGLLPFNVSAAALTTALEGLPGIGVGDVLVIRSGNVYRVEFVGGLAEQDVALLEVNDLGLTAEGPGDVLTVDDSADPTGNVGVLTPTTLTGLGMGGFGTPGTTFNEIQTLRIDADGGTFTLSVGGAGHDRPAGPRHLRRRPGHRTRGDARRGVRDHSRRGVGRGGGRDPGGRRVRDALRRRADQPQPAAGHGERRRPDHPAGARHVRPGPDRDPDRRHHRGELQRGAAAVDHRDRRDLHPVVRRPGERHRPAAVRPVRGRPATGPGGARRDRRRGRGDYPGRRRVRHRVRPRAVGGGRPAAGDRRDRADRRHRGRSTNSRPAATPA